MFVYVYNCDVLHTKSEMIEPKIAKFGAPDQLVTSWFGFDFGSEGSHHSKV